MPGKLPIHLERGSMRPAPAIARTTSASSIREAATGRRLAYFPAAGGLTAAVREALADADCVFFDGTFWSSDELPALGLGTKRAEDMAHLPVGGEAGSLAALRGLPRRAAIYIHVNNTNPLLRDDSPERQGRGGGGLGDRLGRHGGHACDRRTTVTAAARRARSSSRGSAARASSATTTTTATTR